MVSARFLLALAALAASLSISWLPALAEASVVTVVSDLDNTMYSENGGLSNGAGTHIFAGKTKGLLGTLLRRGLISFDIAGAVPAGSTINSVTLTL